MWNSRSQPTLKQEIRFASTPRYIPLPERHLQPLRNILDEEELHVALDLSRNVVIDIFPVRPGKYHLLHARSVGSQDFLFDPAYRLNATAERDLEIREDIRNLRTRKNPLDYLSGHGDVNGNA